MKSKLRIAALVIVGVGVLYFGIQKISGPGIPEEFLNLAGRLGQASSVQIDLLWPQPGSSRHNLTEVRWNRTGKVAVDVLEGPQGRLTFIDGKVKLATADIQPPIPALNDPAKELYDEVLTGFANSSWRKMDPPQHGILPARQDRHWAGITLPFDWADGHEIQLGISKESGKLEVVVIETKAKDNVSVTFRQFRGGTMTFDVSDGPQLWMVIEDTRWNHTLSSDDLDPTQHP
jgi:hypothetical protein